MALENNTEVNEEFEGTEFSPLIAKCMQDMEKLLKSNHDQVYHIVDERAYGKPDQHRIMHSKNTYEFKKMANNLFDELMDTVRDPLRYLETINNIELLYKELSLVEEEDRVTDDFYKIFKSRLIFLDLATAHADRQTKIMQNYSGEVVFTLTTWST